MYRYRYVFPLARRTGASFDLDSLFDKSRYCHRHHSSITGSRRTLESSSAKIYGRTLSSRPLPLRTVAHKDDQPHPVSTMDISARSPPYFLPRAQPPRGIRADFSYTSRPVKKAEPTFYRVIHPGQDAVTRNNVLLLSSSHSLSHFYLPYSSLPPPAPFLTSHAR